MFAKQNKVIDFSSYSGKVPPQCIEAEEAILGGILFDPSAIARVRDQLKPHHFYIGAYSSIYQAMLKLNEQEQPTDLIVIVNYLEANEILAKVGGRNKLASLVDRCVSTVNIDALAALVIGKWKRRELGQLSNLAMSLQHKSDDEVSLEQAFEQLQDYIYCLQQGESNSHSTSHISSVMTDVYQQIEERHQGTALPGIPTGFYDLDAVTSGFNSRQNKRPLLSDLRDSGGIEQDGDKVLMLYRDEYYSSDSPDRGICEIIIAKHRDGATGTIKLLFDNQFTKFKNLVCGGW